MMRFRSVVLVALTISLVGVGVAATSTSYNKKQDNTVASQPAHEESVVYREEVISETFSTPYKTKQYDDNTLAKGVRKVVQEGRAGTRTKTYKVAYNVSGKEIRRVLISDTLTTTPVDEIIAIGTYEAPRSVCPDGSYINSYGYETCRPSAEQGTGATAICRDGTYSYSRNRRGTCSHHGGVLQWL